MARIHHVVACMLEKTGTIRCVKMHQLLYYCQAWHLVWSDKPLFRAAIKAWANNPIIPYLWSRHNGKYVLNYWELGDASRLTNDEMTTIDVIVHHYGGWSSQKLHDLIMKEDPWNLARNGLAPATRGNNTITHASMRKYYTMLSKTAKDKGLIT